MAKSAARSPADKEPAPPQTRRARRRLIGAAALAIAAAIVLTLVLDSEPRGTIREVEVTIPSRTTESAGAGRTPEPTRPGVAARADAPGAVEGRVGTPMVPPPDEPPAAGAGTAMPPAGQAPSSAEPNQANEPDEAAEPAEPPAMAADEAPAQAEAPADEEEVAAADESQPRASGSPAKRRPPGTDVASASATDSGPAPASKASAAAPAAASAGNKAAARPRGYSVQVGAFSSDESARAQAQRVRDAGLPVYTEKILTAQGARIRVRAGPFGNGEEAERARAKLQLAGIESAIIKP